MTEVKHTPGPWKWTGDPLNGCGLMSLSGPVISYAAYENMWFSRYKKDEDLANAHLIAAAPDMEKALEALLGFVGLIMQDRSRMKDVLACQMATAALAKARGEEK